MISLSSRPCLAAGARVVTDRRRAREVLRWPERGFVLGRTAADVLRLCTGANDVTAIVDRLAAVYALDDRAQIERDVLEFLRELAGRGLVREAA